MSQLTPEERAALAEVAYSDYEPEPIRHEPRFPFLRKLLAPIAVAIGLLVKFSFAVFKVFGIFISIAAYALIWGWKFGVGFVALLAIHELGHFLEAKRQGLDVSLPRFIPLFGAYVTIRDAPVNPWQNALVALAGPALGGIGSAVFLGLGEANDSRLLLALAYSGFLLNAVNLLPVWILDGAAVLHAFRLARAEPLVAPSDLAFAGAGPVPLPGSGRGRAGAIMFLYVSLAALLVLGAFAAHVPQSRL